MSSVVADGQATTCAHRQARDRRDTQNHGSVPPRDRLATLTGRHEIASPLFCLHDNTVAFALVRRGPSDRLDYATCKAGHRTGLIAAGSCHRIIAWD